MSLIAKCHCGQTQITVPHAPEKAAQCNCSFCARTGAVWGYFQPGELDITSDTAGKVYSPSGVGNDHHFCGNCGMQTWGVSLDWSSVYNDDGTPKGEPGAMPTTQIFAVNLNLIDDFDRSSIKIDQMDGRNNW